MGFFANAPETASFLAERVSGEMGIARVSRAIDGVSPSISLTIFTVPA
jgi:hypothetical protein